MSTEDPHRHDWRQRFCNDKTQSRFGGLQVTVGRTRPFRENQRHVAGLENPNQRLEGATVDALLIDRDYIEPWQKPAQQWHIQQSAPRQKINRPITSGTCQRRIEITLMVHGENDRTVLKHALRMNHTKTKKQSANKTAKMITKPVIEIHLTSKQFSDLAIRLSVDL